MYSNNIRKDPKEIALQSLIDAGIEEENPEMDMPMELPPEEDENQMRMAGRLFTPGSGWKVLPKS